MDDDNEMEFAKQYVTERGIYISTLVGIKEPRLPGDATTIYRFIGLVQTQYSVVAAIRAESMGLELRLIHYSRIERL